jgi:hypothetical protein
MTRGAQQGLLGRLQTGHLLELEPQLLLLLLLLLACLLRRRLQDSLRHCSSLFR